MIILSWKHLKEKVIYLTFIILKINQLRFQKESIFNLYLVNNIKAAIRIIFFKSHAVVKNF